MTLNNKNEKKQLVKETLTLLDIINSYKYENYFGSNVFTNKYIPVIWSLYNNTNDLYSFIFGDFNKLGELNKKHGEEQMNNVIKIALSKIVECLPTDSITTRYAGDEYCFILPGKTKEQAEKFIEDIKKELENNKESILGLSMTLQAEDNFNEKDIFELFAKTSLEVSEEKNHNEDLTSEIRKARMLKDEKMPEVWESINKKIYKALKKFSLDLRVENSFKVPKESLLDLMRMYRTNVMELLDYNYNAIESNTIENLYKSDLLEFEQSKKINELLNNRDDTFELLEDTSIEDLNEILQIFRQVEKKLTRDHISGLYSKNVFKRQVAPSIAQSNQQYQIIYFSLTGIKFMNKAHGYNYTDNLLKKSAETLISNVEKNVKISNNIFKRELDECYLIDQGGGNYTAFVPSHLSIGEKQIEEIICEVNKNNEGLDMVYSSADVLSADSANRVINHTREMRYACNKQKDAIKAKRLLTGDDSIRLAFIHELRDAVEEFRENIPDYKSKKNRERFITNVLISMIEEFNELNYKNVDVNETKGR